MILSVASACMLAAKALWRIRRALAFRRWKGNNLRFALVSHVLPPSWSGQAIAIGRLARHFGHDSCQLIATPGDVSCRSGGQVPGQVCLPSEWGEMLFLREDAIGDLSVAHRVLIRGWRIARQVEKSGCEVIVSCSGDLIDLPASAFASELTKKPLVVYLFDDYTNQWGHVPIVRARASRLEQRVMRKAAAVIAPNEVMAGVIRERYDIEPTVIRNAAETPPPPHVTFGARQQQGLRTICYTGAVYHVNYDAFRTLIDAMNLLEEYRPRLDIFTAQERQRLEGEGLRGPQVHIHGHVSPSEAVDLQRQADVLFMGFSFDSSVPEVIRSSAPGKLGDYLSSGRPILALTPADSFLSQYLKDHECGLVVDENSPEAVADALLRLFSDEELVQRLVFNAMAQARIEFSSEVTSARFYRLLERVR